MKTLARLIGLRELCPLTAALLTTAVGSNAATPDGAPLKKARIDVQPVSPNAKYAGTSQTTDDLGLAACALTPPWPECRW